MAYTLNRVVTDADFQTVETRTREALAAAGFGIITEIDIQATMKKKIDEDMPAYRILGACNPKLAFQAIQMEPHIGTMLPCNVVVREIDGGVEVSAIDPVASMMAIESEELKAFAGKVREMLEQAVAAV